MLRLYRRTAALHTSDREAVLVDIVDNVRSNPTHCELRDFESGIDTRPKTKVADFEICTSMLRRLATLVLLRHCSLCCGKVKATEFVAQICEMLLRYVDIERDD
uniref:Uncharacterized protein n=1 Tax=Hyaloperonospora arabidopsidis (strain Emoy2) TaxID=559515 RepID=M4BQ61_HYAAE